MLAFRTMSITDMDNLGRKNIIVWHTWFLRLDFRLACRTHVKIIFYYMYVLFICSYYLYVLLLTFVLYTPI